MVTLRKSFQEGHRRKFLVVIDETPECDRAVVYGARRAKHTNGILIMLYVIAPGDFQHWLGVENIMRAEAQQAAEEALRKYADRALETSGVACETIIREGNRAQVILDLIEDDEDIAILVLAASIESEGPGPLVSMIAGSGSAFPIPVTIVPGTLTDDDIAALA
jgi:nucleotide-binding universal stress UspA family protein